MPEDGSMLWQEVCQILSQRVSSERLRTWVLPLRQAGLDDGKLLLLAPNEFVRQGVEKSYLPLLRNALKQISGREMGVELEVDTSFSYNGYEERSSEPRGSTFRAELTFDTFVVGPCNRLAHASALAVADNPGTVYNPLFLHGKEGLGKTHLLQAICQRLVSASPRAQVVYLPCESFVSQYIGALERSTVAEFQQHHANVDAFAVDDVQLLRGRPQAQEQFFHIFNLLHEAKKQIVLSADCLPQHIDLLEPRLTSRFNWGLVARLDAPAFETRTAILRKKADYSGLKVDESVLELIAGIEVPNVRELLAAFTRTLAYASLAGRKLTKGLAREALEEAAGFRKRPSIDDILIAVTQHFGATTSELQSEKRGKWLVLPRQVSMYLARRLTDHSLKEIGAYFGGRNHSTVLRAATRVENLARQDAHLRDLLLQLEARL